MAKIFKFTGYFVDPAGECNKRDVKTALEEVTTKALDIFSHHVEVKEVELGESPSQYERFLCERVREIFRGGLSWLTASPSPK